MDDLYSLFRILSRVIVIFAIIVLIIGLITKFNKQSFVTPPVIQENTTVKNFNLKGPFVCNFSLKQASISAFIKDNHAYAKVEEPSKITNVFWNGNCIYAWNNFATSGQKICGISWSLIERFNLSKNIPAILTTCKKEEIKDTSIFKVPQNITFQEKKIF